jgi:hypothetical protein
MSKKLTTKEFIEKAISVHDKKYDYSRVNYINNHTKVLIKCNRCGNEFEVTPNNHLSQKHGCPLCNHRSYSYTNDEFIKKAVILNGDTFDYSKVDYKNNRTKIIIKHNNCGKWFWQTPSKHLSGQGCPYCAKNKKLTTDEFAKKAAIRHNNKYDYSKVEYKCTDKKVCIICPEHGEFWQTPHSHLKGCGCPKCDEEINVSETKLYNFLKSNLDSTILREYKPLWLNGKSLDIFIPEKMIGIEYQGIQHFEPVKYFGGIKRFSKNVNNDKMKFKECKENGVKLFYFSYEKRTPKQYIDNVYTKENNLLNEIKNYDNNRKGERLI